MITAMEKLVKARTHLIMDKEFCFFGLLLMKTDFVEDNRMQTAATDGKVIRFNSEFIMQLSMAQTKGVLAHEIAHIFLGHVWRKGNRNHDNWNIAADYITNETILRAGLSLPDGCLVDPQYDGLSSEEVYRRIHEENQKQEEQDQQTGDSADTDGQKGGQSQKDDDSVDNKPDQDDEGNEGQDDDSDTNEDTAGDTDSDSNGEYQDEDNDEDQAGTEDGQADKDFDGQYTDKGGCGGILEPADDDDSDNLEAEWKEAISQAVQWSDNLPSGVREIVEKILNPPLPWTAILEDFIEYTARNDYNWNVPDSRFFSDGIILPSLISEELPEVVICIDTSGSIDKRALAIFSEEASNVLATYDTTVRVIYCDDKVHGEEVFTKADLPMKMNPLGGGCTDFRPAFNHVEKNGYLPSCMIYFTDLYGSFPQQEPDYPVLWVTQTKTRKAPFGKTVLFT